RGRPSLADVQHLGITETADRIAAVRDECAGHRVDSEDERQRKKSGGDERSCDDPACATSRWLHEQVAGHHESARREAGHYQELLSALAADPRDERQAGAERTDDRPGG